MGVVNFMIDCDGALEFLVCLEGMVLVWVVCWVLTTWGIDLLIKCMIPLEFPLLLVVCNRGDTMNVNG